MKDGKSALICIGGGMRSAHGAGFLFALGTHFPQLRPDIVIATSGNAPNAAYFLTRQPECLRRVWTRELSTPKFISLMRPTRIMDIDYLIDVVLKQKEPLDTDVLRASDVQWLIPATRFEDGTTVYFDQEHTKDPYEVLRASCAIPVLFGKHISIDGTDYIDGEFGSILDDYIQKVKSLGATRILVLNDASQWHGISRLIIRRYMQGVPRDMQAAILRDITTDSHHLPNYPLRIQHVLPKDLRVGTFTRRQDRITAAFESGVSDALALEAELKTLFAPSSYESSYPQESAA